MADFNVACSQCNTLLQVNTELIGSMVQCPTCGNTFTVTAPQQAPAPMQQAPAPQFTPQFQAPAPGSAPAAASNPASDLAAKAGNAANAARNILKKGNASTGMAALALVIALISLIYSIFFTSSFPALSYSKNPEKACKAYIKQRIEERALGNYDYYKNGSKAKIKTEKAITGGDYAVVRYSVEREGTTYKDVMILKKNKDGYYLRESDYDNDAPKSLITEAAAKCKDWESKTTLSDVMK